MRELLYYAHHVPAYFEFNTLSCALFSHCHILHLFLHRLLLNPQVLDELSPIQS